MDVMRKIEYRFLHWGPFVCHYRMTPEEIKTLDSIEEKEDYNKSLAGHINYEKGLDYNKVFETLSPYLQSYLQGFHEYRGKKLASSFELLSSWVNRQKKYEFNPPHTHDEDLSFVVYTKVPAGLEAECIKSVSNSPGPGCIVFDFNMPTFSKNNNLILQTHAHLPDVGDLFIFPAQLPHWVYPFKETEGERVSISGNIRLDGSKEK